MAKFTDKQNDKQQEVEQMGRDGGNDHIALSTEEAQVDIPNKKLHEIQDEQIVNQELTEADLEKVLILNFGGQYTQLIGRAVRRQNVYAEIQPYDVPFDYIVKGNYDAIILGGGPHSAYKDDAANPDPRILELGVPILGICYGAQWIAQNTGGRVGPSDTGEYGKTEVIFKSSVPFFANLTRRTTVWMTHSDEIYEVGDDYEVRAYSENGPIAAFSHKTLPITGVQFHPEVELTDKGVEMFDATLHSDMDLGKAWKYDMLIDRTIEDLQSRCSDDAVIVGYSGGVTSMVLSILAKRALGDKARFVFVDTGLARADEKDRAMQVFTNTIGGKLHIIDAQDEFFDALKNITDSNQKRLIVGERFIRVFEREAEACGALTLLLGSSYPSVVESGVHGVPVKAHHNVGAIPESNTFQHIFHPLHELFKDEIRIIAKELKCPHDYIWQKPFPGIGHAIRVLGQVTPDKVALVQHADRILEEEFDKADFTRKVSQFFTVLSDKSFIGSKGDIVTMEYMLILRAVITNDYLTAEIAEIPYPLLKQVTSRIINEVGHINRVVYEVTGKPSGTIEWE